jgi:hypothetical protein
MTSDTKDALNQLAESVLNARVALAACKPTDALGVRLLVEIQDDLDDMENSVIEIQDNYAAIERATE